MARESDLERRFNHEIRRRRGISIKIAPLQAGVPDRLVLLPDRPPILVELKAEDGRLEAVQVLWHDRARAIGHEVVTLQGRAEIDSWLANIDGQDDDLL